MSNLPHATVFIFVSLLSFTPMPHGIVYKPKYQIPTIQFCHCWDMQDVVALNETSVKVFIAIHTGKTMCKEAAEKLRYNNIALKLWVEKLNNSSVTVTKSFTEPNTCVIQTVYGLNTKQENVTECVYTYNNISFDRDLNRNLYIESTQVRDCNQRKLAIDWSVLPTTTMATKELKTPTAPIKMETASILLPAMMISISGCTITILIFVAMMTRRRKFCSRPQTTGGTTSAIQENIPLLQLHKDVLLIAIPECSTGNIQILLEVLNSFQELNVIYAENHVTEISKNSHTWTHRQTSCGEIVVCLTTEFCNHILSGSKTEDLNVAHPLTEVTINLFNKVYEKYYVSKSNVYYVIIEEINPSLLNDFFSRMEALRNCSRFYLTAMFEKRTFDGWEQARLKNLLKALLEGVQLDNSLGLSKDEYISRKLTDRSLIGPDSFSELPKKSRSNVI